MSRSTVIAALLLAVALAAAALFLLAPAVPPPPTQAGMDFEPSAVAELAIARPGESPLRVVRGKTPSDWRVLTAADDAGWPVLTQRVRPALRILAGATLAHDPELQRPGPDAPSITIRLDDGSERTLRIGKKHLAGRVPAELITPDTRAVGFIGADVAEAFINTGPLAWRDLALFPLAGPEAARIRVAASDRRIALTRVQGRWSLAEPLAAPADHDAVAKLIALLAAAKITDFIETPAEHDAAAAALATTTAEIHIEADARELTADTVRSRTVSNTLVVGSSGDLGGQRVFARLRRADEGDPDAALDRLVSIERDSLNPVSTDPAFYLSKTAAQAQTSDVTTFSITLAHDNAAPTSFRRGLDGWTRADQATPIVPEDAAGVTAAAALLTGAPATRILLAAPDNAGPLARVEMSTLAGDPLAPIDLALLVTPEGPSLAAQTGQVWRVYAAKHAEPVLRWLERLAAEAPGPAELP